MLSELNDCENNSNMKCIGAPQKRTPVASFFVQADGSVSVRHSAPKHEDSQVAIFFVLTHLGKS